MNKIEQIKYLASTDLEQALEQAKKNCDNQEFQKDLRLLNGNLNDAKKSENLTRISQEELRTIRQRTREGLENLLDRYKDALINSNDVPSPNTSDSSEVSQITPSQRVPSNPHEGLPPPYRKVIRFWFFIIIVILSIFIPFFLYDNGYFRSNKIEFQTPKMVKIEGGNYTIGTTEEAKSRQMKENNIVEHYLFNNEMPTVNIEIKDFSIGKYEVTIGEYNEFLKANNKTILKGNSNLPVSNVTWFDAIEYCNWLSKKTGDHYDLPTEAEWEIAARGKDDYCFPWGDNPSKGIHNPYFGKDTLIPVNDFPAGKTNKKEIFNMAGNVLEWCKEAYKNSKTGNNDINLPVRGGSWYDNSVFKLRCSTRSFMPPDSKRIDIGFRIVRR